MGPQDKAAYRVRLVLEKTAALGTSDPWVGIDAEVMALYDDAEQDPSLFSTIDAAKAARMFFQGVLEERESHKVRGGKGL